MYIRYQETSVGEASFCSEKSLDLARRMIAHDATKRITIDNALRHAFFVETNGPTSPTKRVANLNKLVPLADNVNVVA